jgi:hypothetical protein
MIICLLGKTADDNPNNTEKDKYSYNCTGHQEMIHPTGTLPEDSFPAQLGDEKKEEAKQNPEKKEFRPRTDHKYANPIKDKQNTEDL